MKFSIVMAAYNEGRDLEATVALCAASDPAPYEIIVVDDQSTWPVHQRLSSPMHDTVKVVETPDRLGAGPAKAFGMRYVTGDVAIIMDAHMRMPWDWLWKVEECHRRYPDAIMSAACRDFTMRSAWIGAGASLDGAQQPWVETKWLNRGHIETTDRCPAILGGAYIVPMHVWNGVGGLNPAYYGWGHEEPDLSIRAWLCGYEVRRINGLMILHHYSRKPDAPGDRLASWHALYNAMVASATLFEDGVFERHYQPFLVQLDDSGKATTRFEACMGEINAARADFQARRRFDDRMLESLCGYRIPTVDHQRKCVENILEVRAKKKRPSVALAYEREIDTADELRQARQIAVVGLRRSGHHAVIDWIAQHFREGAVHFNDLPWPLKKPVEEYHTRNFGKGQGRQEILSWEDQPFDLPVRGHKIIVVRSFYNMMASRIQALRMKHAGAASDHYFDIERAISLWPDHARHATLLYDRWLMDVKYARAFEKERSWIRCQLPRQTSRVGRGSSFEGMNHRQENLLRRFEEMDREDPSWKTVLDADECREVNLEVFGWAIDRQGRVYKKKGVMAAAC